MRARRVQKTHFRVTVKGEWLVVKDCCFSVTATLSRWIAVESVFNIIFSLLSFNCATLCVRSQSVICITFTVSSARVESWICRRRTVMVVVSRMVS